MTASKASFPKTERLKRSSEFRSILKEARSVRQNGIVLYFAENHSVRGNRLGIIVSRRVFKNATDRNRAKRVVREFFRLRKADFQGNFNLVVRFVEGCKLPYSNELGCSLGRLFEKAGILLERETRPTQAGDEK